MKRLSGEAGIKNGTAPMHEDIGAVCCICCLCYLEQLLEIVVRRIEWNRDDHCLLLMLVSYWFLRVLIEGRCPPGSMVRIPGHRGILQNSCKCISILYVGGDGMKRLWFESGL
jgi:hypothetical protein